jgi:hypothetical protein
VLRWGWAVRREGNLGTEPELKRWVEGREEKRREEEGVAGAVGRG